MILPFHSALFHEELVPCKVTFEFSVVRFMAWFTSLQHSLLQPSCCLSASESPGALSSHRQPTETGDGRSWMDSLLPSPGHSLFASLAKGVWHWRNKERRPLPKGFTSKQMLVQGYLKISRWMTSQWEISSWLNERVCGKCLLPMSNSSSAEKAGSSGDIAASFSWNRMQD